MIVRAYFFLAITALGWGGNAVAGKLAAGHISPMLLTSFRWALAVALIGMFSIKHLRRDWAVIRGNLPILFGYGAIGFTVFNILLYSALVHTSAINVVIEQAGMPLVIFGLNFLLFRTQATLAQLVGFVLTITGVIITASNGSLEALLNLQLNRGDALMLLAVLVYAGYTVCLRWKPEMHWQSLMTTLAFMALLASIPFAIWEYQSGAVILPDVQGWGVVIYAAIIPSLVCQVLFILGNEMIGANRAGLFVNLVPIFGTLLSIIILGERLGFHHMIAIILVFGGIAIAERWKPNRQEA